MKFVLTLALGFLLCLGFYNWGTVRGAATMASSFADQASSCVKQCNATPPGATAKK